MDSKITETEEEFQDPGIAGRQGPDGGPPARKKTKRWKIRLCP